MLQGSPASRRGASPCSRCCARGHGAGPGKRGRSWPRLHVAAVPRRRDEGRPGL